jgi:hypothetical protein
MEFRNFGGLVHGLHAVFGRWLNGRLPEASE